MSIARAVKKITENRKNYLKMCVKSFFLKIKKNNLHNFTIKD